jgi:hypothetical protein
LRELCAGFYANGLEFDLIGHTSNTLYDPDYTVERVVSIRKLTHFEIKGSFIECDCGVPVKKLAKDAVEDGISGFEGLVDLPGTVSAAIYGNASCYDSSISELLVEANILTAEGKLETVEPDWFSFAKRSSSLKRKEKKAVIISVKLRANKGNKSDIVNQAEYNHNKRKQTQPPAQGTLGSVFGNEGRPSILNLVITGITKIYALLLKYTGGSDIEKKRKHLAFCLLRAKDVEPYVHHWNCYWWRDDDAHKLFWKYVRLHRLMFTRSEFEIEIKHNSNFKIP